MVDYSYPDVNDVLTSTFVKGQEPFPGYWYRSEQTILDQVKKTIQKRIPKAGASMLDAGCGKGRLILEFHRFFETIHAIEPDVERIEYAKKAVTSSKLATQVSFEAVSIEELDESRKFDVILCSHIIQHVHTEQLPLIFEKFKRLMKNQGLLVILTCHSRKPYDYFTKELFIGSEVVEKKISNEEFNSLTSNESGVLPHHCFSMRNLIQSLERLPTRIIVTKSFHILNNLDGLDHFIFRDKLINTFPFLKSRFGRDMMLLVENIL